MITMYTVNFHPPFAHGTVRDIRVRWGLEEAGISYRTHILTQAELSAAEYRRISPLGKIPALVDGELAVFESAAILLYLGEQCDVILPRNLQEKTRTTAWMCAAVSTMESTVDALCRIDHFTINREADLAIRPRVEHVVGMRLQRLSEALEGREYLEKRFTGADIMMRSVLDMLRHTDLVSRYPVLKDYMARCALRPAFQRAMRDHLAAYAKEPGVTAS